MQEEDLAGYARQLGLDMERFETDRHDDATQRRIRQGRVAGARSGVNGTPTFFINGSRYDGDHTFEGLAAAVQSARSR